jgi:hypothetical protein
MESDQWLHMLFIMFFFVAYTRKYPPAYKLVPVQEGEDSFYFLVIMTEPYASHDASEKEPPADELVPVQEGEGLHGE